MLFIKSINFDHIECLTLTEEKTNFDLCYKNTRQLPGILPKFLKSLWI